MGSYYDEDVLEVREMPRFEREQVFETFLKSGSAAILYGSESCAYVALAVKVTGGGRGRYLSRNSTGGTHAEVKMATFLREAVANGSLSKKQTLVAYLNFSPCHDCSEHLWRLKREVLDREGLGLELVVAHLYKGEEEGNRRGLRELQAQGVVVRAFHGSGHQDWNSLSHGVLEVGGYRYSQDSDRRHSDAHVAQRLADILQEDEEVYWQPTQTGRNTAYNNHCITDIIPTPKPVKVSAKQSQHVKNGAPHTPRESFVLSMPEQDEPAQKKCWLSLCSIL